MEHELKEINLEQGAKALFIDIPGSLAVDTLATLNAGFLFNTPKQFELPHVMEHMMFTTTKHPKKNQFSAAVERYGAMSNAFTNFFQIGYVYQCAGFDTKRILGLLGEQLTRPLFDGQELTTEVGNVREELSNYLSDHDRLSNENLYVAMTNLPTLGERITQLSSMTAGDLKRFYRKTHTSANLRVLVAGDLARHGTVVKSQLKSLSRQLPAGQPLSLPRLDYHALDKPVIETRNIEQVYFHCFSYAGEQLPLPEYRGAQLVDRLLSAGFKSRIFGRVRERGLAYGFSSGVAREPHNTEFWFASFATADNIEEVFQIVTEEVQDVLAGNVSDREFEEVKDLVKGVFARRFQSTDSLISYYKTYALFGDYLPFTEYPELIDAITKEEALESFRKLFARRTWGLSLVGNIKARQAARLKRTLDGIWQ